MVDQELEKKLKTVGFRWVSVNHTQDCRMTIYQIKRPLNTIAHKTARRKQAYPVVAEHLTIFSSQPTDSKKYPSRCLVSGVALLDMLREHKKEEFETLAKEDRFAHLIDCDKKIEDFMAD